MKKRLPYIIATVLLLATEIYIGMFVRDKFIRPFGGDILVTALICCIVRSVIGRARLDGYKGSALLSAGVLLFSIVVEVTQYFSLDELLGVKGTVLGVIIGSSFAWLDIVCYAVGCLAFFIVECVCLAVAKKNKI